VTPREFLYSLELHGIKLGLDNITRLLRVADNPQQRRPTVHVAGTNGKGSVLAQLDAMLRAGGYTTGRFTQPHLVDLNERFLINGAPVDDAALDRHLTVFHDAAKTMDPLPTFFEMCTAVAFQCFAERRVDAALIEVGMGGRFDATNVITPLACAITNIDFEHTQYLGDTLGKIAFEKAGIIKPGVPVVIAETQAEPLKVILERARELGAPAYCLGRDFDYEIDGAPFALRFTYRSETLALDSVPLGLTGAYQGANAAASVALAERLGSHFPGLDGEAIVQGLREARWPCRLERVLDDPPVIIDVAHNPAGARKLAAELGDCVVVLALSFDKDGAGVIEALAPIARELILTQFQGRRAKPLDELAGAAAGRPHTRAENLDAAIALGLSLASASLPLLITGGLYTAGEARQILVKEYAAKTLKF